MNCIFAVGCNGSAEGRVGECGCNVVAILSMGDMVCLACMQKLHVVCMSSTGFVLYVGML